MPVFVAGFEPTLHSSYTIFSFSYRGLRLSLNYPADWKFQGVGSAMPPDAIAAFNNLPVDVADRFVRF